MTHYLLERTADPVTESVSLTEAKDYLRVDGSDDDSLITDMIVAAREFAEEYLAKSLITQSWKLAFDETAPACTRLPMGPVQSVTSVKLIAEDDSETIIDTSLYGLNAAKDTLVFDEVSIGHQVEIVYVTGYGNNASDVPAGIRQGILRHIAHLYEHRMTSLPPEFVDTAYDFGKEVRL